MRVGIAQLNSCDNVEKNLKEIYALIESSIKKKEGAKLFVFPENALFMRASSTSKVRSIELSELEPLQKLSNQEQVRILIGSIANGSPKPFNSMVLIEPLQPAKVVYKKIHLFDVEVKGDRSYSESKDFLAGERPEVLDIDGWKWGLNICYDLRFSELQTYYYSKKVDVLFYPSAFTVPTGMAHWEVLLRARAIEGQCFVVAPAQTGEHGGGRRTYGHSMVIDPWGEIILKNESDTGLFVVEMDRNAIGRARSQIPTHSHRKKEILKLL